MEVKVYNQNGKVAGKTRLPAEIFGIPLNPDLINQVIVTYLSRRRAGTAKTKSRAERRGGGKKPWPQKGTGRARTGSLRSPIFRKGGVVFGPRLGRNYKKKINKKMKRKAFLMALSSKVKDKEIIVLEDLKLEKIKTKNLEKILIRLKAIGKKTLLVLPQKDEIIEKSGRNLVGLTIKRASNLNTFDVLASKWLIITKNSLEVIKKNYQKSGS